MNTGEDDLGFPSGDQENADSQQQQQQTDDGQQQQQQQQQPQATSMLSKDDLAGFAKELGTTLLAGQQQSQQQQQQLSPEELDKALNVWNPSDDLYDRLSDPQTRKAAFVEMRDGMLKQALTAVQHILGAELEKVRGEFQPVQQFASEQRAERMRSQFLEQFPALGKYQKILPMVTAALEREGFKPKSVEDGFKRLADEATKVIKEHFDPNFEATKKQDQQNQDGRPPMAKGHSAGGQGGASSTKSGGNQSPDDGLWD